MPAMKGLWEQTQQNEIRRGNGEKKRGLSRRASASEKEKQKKHAIRYSMRMNDVRLKETVLLHAKVEERTLETSSSTFARWALHALQLYTLPSR